MRSRLLEWVVMLSALVGLEMVSPGCCFAGEIGPRLRVAPSGRFLQTAEGEPFFYLGDTAWELFHRTTRDEAELYLRDRAAKGFTVIQAVVLAELDGLHTPNAYGHVPLIDDDPARPRIGPGKNDDYWDHVDFVVDKAVELGLFVGMLPTWGDKWNKKWGIGPVVFTPENAEKYGEFLGRRYRDKPIVWILGGDRNPENETHMAVVRALARGLERGDGAAHLMTYHPQGGGNSADWFHEDAWLDFNMFQSGHGKRFNPNYRETLDAYRRVPVKPVLDGEPRYEDHPVAWKPDGEWFGAWDVRQAAYWSMLSGACGHTYGNHNIWQMWLPGRDPISWARTPWKEALHHPGSKQMGYMKTLFQRRPFWRLVPDESLVVDPLEGADHRRAATAEDGSYAVVYLPTGGSVTIRSKRLRGHHVIAWWFDPRTGLSREVGRFSRTLEYTINSPSKGEGNDWVLVLDAADAPLPPLDED